MWGLDKIRIYNAETSVTMPRTREIKVGGKNEYKERTMASGRKVRDITGHRVEITAEWDYVPASDMAALVALIRTGEFLSVDYPDPTGTDGTGLFGVSVPTPGVFKFINGAPMWHGVSLTLTAQEVI